MDFPVDAHVRIHPEAHLHFVFRPRRHRRLNGQRLVLRLAKKRPHRNGIKPPRLREVLRKGRHLLRGESFAFLIRDKRAQIVFSNLTSFKLRCAELPARAGAPVNDPASLLALDGNFQTRLFKVGVKVALCQREAVKLGFEAVVVRMPQGRALRRNRRQQFFDIRVVCGLPGHHDVRRLKRHRFSQRHGHHGLVIFVRHRDLRRVVAKRLQGFGRRPHKTRLVNVAVRVRREPRHRDSHVFLRFAIRPPHRHIGRHHPEGGAGQKSHPASNELPHDAVRSAKKAPAAPDSSRFQVRPALSTSRWRAESDRFQGRAPAAAAPTKETGGWTSE